MRARCGRLARRRAREPDDRRADVTGEDVNSAASDLQDAGFTVEEIDKSVTSSSQNGVVIDEQPAGGTQAPEGAKITIVVARSTGG